MEALQANIIAELKEVQVDVKKEFIDKIGLLKTEMSEFRGEMGQHLNDIVADLKEITGSRRPSSEWPTSGLQRGYQLEERTADSKCEPVSDSDTHLSGKNDKSTEGGDETISASAACSDGGNEEEKMQDHTSRKEETITKAAEQMKTAAEIEQKFNQAEGDVEDSEKNDEDTAEQPEIKPGPCEPKETAAEQMTTAAEIQLKCDQAEGDVDDSEKNDEDTAEQPEIKPGPCEPKETAAEQMTTAAEIEQKFNQAEGDVEDSEKNDEDTAEQPEIKPGPCEPKETAAEQMTTAAEIQLKT
ncbi:cytochrome c1-like [Melanotaenia boesemani]|uniref:cytochrome c1-like n=1 Tax=Melanotaenia boesemani TaxID=1250792 RepID=UPI001C04F279|nr:cytochrome c1-like [Melanotaenia boesemani]